MWIPSLKGGCTSRRSSERSSFPRGYPLLLKLLLQLIKLGGRADYRRQQHLPCVVLSARAAHPSSLNRSLAAVAFRF